MKVTKDRNGLVNVTGLTQREALAITTLLGSSAGGVISANMYLEFARLFKNNLNMHETLIDASKSGNNYIYFDAKAFNSYGNRVLNEKDANNSPKPVSNQRRDASGRFLKKVWVARFLYPASSNPWAKIPRTVITSETARVRPVWLYRNSIEGVDLTRGAFRKFNVDKIVGEVRWTREYADEVKG